MPDFPHGTGAFVEMLHFTTVELRDAILACKSSYSCGPDGYPSKLLKLFPELCTHLGSLFNMSINQQLESKLLVENYINRLV